MKSLYNFVWTLVQTVEYEKSKAILNVQGQITSQEISFCDEISVIDVI